MDCDTPISVQTSENSWLGDEETLAILVNELERLRFQDPQICLARLNTLLEVAERHDNRLAQGVFWYIQSECEKFRSNMATAYRCAVTSVGLLELLNYPGYYVRALNALALSQSEVGDPATAFGTLGSAMGLAESENLPKELAFTCLNLGYLYSVHEQPENSLKYYDRIRRDLAGFCEPKTLILAYNNTAGCFNELGRYEEALPMVESGLARIIHVGSNGPHTAS